MKEPVPAPISVGLLLSYKCSARCRHCMYACSPGWPGDWITELDLERTIKEVAPYLHPSPFGPDTVSLSHGLHFTGGEPFLNFPLLLRAVKTAVTFKIPSTFVETNCIWAVNDELTREKLQQLKRSGLNGIMISVNPFYLEYVPFERTRRCVTISQEIFGQNAMIYQQEFYYQFLQLGISDRLTLREYLALPGSRQAIQYTEFFMMGRAPYQAHRLPEGIISTFPASYFFYQPCDPPFLREWHNHVDNYGHYIPGFCGGISLGDIGNLKKLIEEGIELSLYPILNFIIKNDFKSLNEFACQQGYAGENRTYYSKCHLCVDVRKFLATKDHYRELQPYHFYRQLD